MKNSINFVSYLVINNLLHVTDGQWWKISIYQPYVTCDPAFFVLFFKNTIISSWLCTRWYSKKLFRNTWNSFDSSSLCFSFLFFFSFFPLKLQIWFNVNSIFLYGINIFLLSDFFLHENSHYFFFFFSRYTVGTVKARDKKWKDKIKGIHDRAVTCFFFFLPISILRSIIFGHLPFIIIRNTI